MGGKNKTIKSFQKCVAQNEKFVQEIGKEEGYFENCKSNVNTRDSLNEIGKGVGTFEIEVGIF